MKKRIIVSGLVFCLLFAFSLFASAMPAENALETHAVNAQTPSGASVNTIVLGEGDKLCVQIYAMGESLVDHSFLLQYNASAFAHTATSVETYDGKITLSAAVYAADSLMFTCDVNENTNFTGMVLLARVYFDCTAAASETVYNFSLLHGNNTALCSPLTAKISHRHVYGTWKTISTSADGTMQNQERKCMHCDSVETREIPVLDYSVSLQTGAQKMAYDKEKNMFYAIAPGTTVGTLLINIVTEGNLQVVDSKGNGRSSNDILTTGMTVLVLDDGDIEVLVRNSVPISVCGDADGSGTVTSADSRTALRKSVGLENILSAAEERALDCDADGTVTAADARFLLRVSVGLDAFYAVDASSVALDKTQINLFTGESATLTATIAPADTTVKTITWTSSNNNIVSVSGGKITAKGDGAAVITATANSGASASCQIIVLQPVETVTTTRTNFYLPENSKLDLSAFITYVPANAFVAGTTWQSSNPAFSVANGVVQCSQSYSAVADKTTTVTVAYPGGRSLQLHITLIPKTASFCQFNYEKISVSVGQKFSLRGTGSAESTFTLKSSDTSVLAVGISDGQTVITAVGSGIANIVCESVEYSTVCTVAVNTATAKSDNIHVVAYDAFADNYDLSLTLRNATRKNIKQLVITVASYDEDGDVLETKRLGLENIASDYIAQTYVWSVGQIWSDESADHMAIKQLDITYADNSSQMIADDAVYFAN